MKNLSASAYLVLIVATCIIFSLGFLGLCSVLRSTTPVAIAAPSARTVDELIGRWVLIKFITGAGYGHAHEKVKGSILDRRGQFLVIQERRSKKIIWCNLQTISTVWLEE